MAFLSAESKRSPAFQLSLRLETFTSLIPIPTYVYFIIVTGAYEGEARIRALVIAALIVGGGNVAWSFIYRWFALKKLMADLTRLKALPDAPITDKIKLHHRLLAYPYREGRIIIARWVVGVIAGTLIVIVQIKEITFYALFVEAYSLLIVVPISYVMYLFMSESLLRPVLQDPLFAGLPAAGQRIRETSFLTRLLITIASVTITPVAIFAFLLYTTVSGRLSLKHPEVHILLLSLEALAAIVIVSYRTAKSVRLSIRDTNDVLQQLAKGDFAVNSARATTDEFGQQAELVGAVARDLSRMYREVNELNETLEQRVEQRTAELNQTLEQVRHLKHYQDGDYFLTTLLLKPLNSNYVKSDRVAVEFFLRQKKDFEFKGVSHDIGGDLCSAHMVRLRDREYVVFLNADAMGKSMQGAGGALVLGAVFYSIVERTRSVASMQQLAPERWLKNAFIELDKVFESFDGSMLVSLVLGLVDTQTGLLYYVNAEHPWSILYRGNEASFIENELSLRKLGMSSDGRITVRVFEMQPGDVLICGSDGRDDILLHTPDGRPKMNEDEDLILSAVVSAKGKLPQVYEICAQRGEITDDYSLLKIAYFGDTMPETEKTAMRSASGAYYRAQNYLKAIVEGEKYLNSRPADTQFMRFLSRCHRLAGNYEIAIDLAERLRLRQPDDTRNLTNLAAMHILRGDASRAQQLVAEIRALDAQYPALRKLDELLERRARRAR